MNSIVVWNNKILLKWDKKIPEHAKPNSIHTPDDIIYWWEHLDGFTSFAKRSGMYTMSFSRQNISRLKKQFGVFQIERGQEEIRSLVDKVKLFDELVKKAEMIKALPAEQLPQYQYKVPPLGEFQHREVVFLVEMPLSPIFADCGTGKTFCVLCSTEQQIKQRLITPGKTLICGKLATLESGWLEDAANFTNLKVVSLWLPQSSKRKEKILERLNEPADAYVINHDGVRVFEEALLAKRFEKVVVDESTILKGFHGMDAHIKGGAFGRSLVRISQYAKYKVIMSGTPAPNGPIDLWGQMHFLDQDGLLLDPVFNDFRNDNYFKVDLRREEDRYREDGRYRPMGPKTPKKWELKQGALARVSNLVTPLSYRVKIRDHIKDLPELSIMKRQIELTAEQRKHYDDMENRLCVEIDQERIAVPIILTKLMKLRQITGGFIIDNEGKSHQLESNPKVEELDSLLEEEIDPNDKVVIYAQYKWEIEMIESRYKHFKIVPVYGENYSRENLDNIDRFRKDPECRLIVLHPKCAAHGVTFTMAHYMIFYSIDYSAENNYQCVKRIERAGQKEPMFVYYLLGRKSIDQTIYDALKVKEHIQSQIIDPGWQDTANNSILTSWRVNKHET
jgi:SNF2 family DNA or RNA helicase